MSALLWAIVALIIIAPIITDRLNTRGWFRTAAAIEWTSAITCAVLFIIWSALCFTGTP